MTRILLLSDSHSYCDDRIIAYAQQADEIWHAGDFGVQVAEQLSAIKPLKAVFGNIDGTEIRKSYPEVLNFQCEKVRITMLHIGGYPERYTTLAKNEIQNFRPQIFISGHSHILKVMHDKTYDLLHLNPGACGKIGWHKVRTMLRFVIDAHEIKDLEVIELGLK